MLRVLLTGFEPFAGATDNPSQRVARALAADPPDSVRLATAILPVRYAEAGGALHAALRRHQPELVIATGLAGGRAELSVERVAINVDDADLADNAGERLIDRPVVADGPAAYFATVPIKGMVAAIRTAGVPASVSHSAGTFLCNHIFYLACHHAARAAPGMRVGFVHLPWLPEQAVAHRGEPSMSLDTMVAGLRAAIAACRASGFDLAVAEGAVS